MPGCHTGNGEKISCSQAKPVRAWRKATERDSRARAPQALLTGDAWDDGELFRPERFLCAGGARVERNEFLIPFSVGKRVCPGEGLARAEIFLFLARLLQKFRFEPEDENDPPPVVYKRGLTSVPLPFNVKILKLDRDEA